MGLRKVFEIGDRVTAWYPHPPPKYPLSIDYNADHWRVATVIDVHPIYGGFFYSLSLDGLPSLNGVMAIETVVLPLGILDELASLDEMLES